jgi:hypothetical protein
MVGRAGFACISAVALSSMFPPATAYAQSPGINFETSFELGVDCDRPVQVRDFHVQGRGTGVLRADRTGSADLQITTLATSTIHFDGRLGGAPRPAPGGTTSEMHVVGGNRLRLIWNLPNNQLIADLVLSKHGCTAIPGVRLKPGMREYSLFDGNGYYYCARPRVLRTSCRAF